MRWLSLGSTCWTSSFGGRAGPGLAAAGGAPVGGGGGEGGNARARDWLRRWPHRWLTWRQERSTRRPGGAGCASFGIDADTARGLAPSPRPPTELADGFGREGRPTTRGASIHPMLRWVPGSPRPLVRLTGTGSAIRR